MRGKILVFLIGVVVGVLAALLLPGKLRPLIPRRVLGAATQGEVAAKGREADRLLLTVITAEGATLATFSKKIPEIDLLVEVGDRVSLGLGGYRPFVEDPAIWRVEKPETAREIGAEPVAPAERATQEPGPSAEPPTATETPGATGDEEAVPPPEPPRSG